MLRRWLGLPPGQTCHGATGSTLTAIERAVLDVLTTTGTAMTAAQIMAATATSPAATGKALRYLEHAGKVHRRHVAGNATRRWHYEWWITADRASGEA